LDEEVRMMGGRIRSACVAFGAAACVYSALLPLRAEAQQAISVELRVEGHQEVLAEARSQFIEALDSIPDVSVVDSGADWQLLVLAAEMHSGTTDLGIVIGATLLEVVDGNDLAAVDPELNPDLGRYLQRQPLGVYKNMWVYFGGPRDMSRVARQVVSEIDATVFDPCRRDATARVRSAGRLGPPGPET
jgi:hypothetical protein